ncbi:MAG TPA: hypothetical protein VMM93_03810 [Vicinamibacterales bacterium]|nr:hypothetical protein [Vicinamibacterales bacterium]
MAPLELALNLSPRARFDVIDVRRRAAEVYGDALAPYRRCFYMSAHTTAGYLPQSLAARLDARRGGLQRYLEIFRAMFPEGAGYRHDQLDLRHELPPEQREVEPANADSHLAFMGGGLHACVSYDAQRQGPVYFVDLDGTNRGVPRRRTTTLVGYNDEVEVARTTVQVPVSAHPIDAINLKEPRLGLYAQLSAFIARHDVPKGRLRLELASGEQCASLTINEYETLLMRHDLAEVLTDPLRFATERARHVWQDPRTVPAKALGYAKYDFVRALNGLVEALGLQKSRIEQIVARALEVPASRFLRMHRSVNLLVSDARTPGASEIVVGTYQAPILVQWRASDADVRTVNAILTRFN